MIIVFDLRCLEWNLGLQALRQRLNVADKLGIEAGDGRVSWEQAGLSVVRESDGPFLDSSTEGQAL